MLIPPRKIIYKWMYSEKWRGAAEMSEGGQCVVIGGNQAWGAHHCLVYTDVEL